MRMKNYFWFKVTFIVFIIVIGGCKKQKTTIEPPPPPPVEEPPPPPPPPPPDTSHEQVFNQAELDAEFERKVRENLRTIYFDYDSYALKTGVTDQLAIAGNFLMEHSTVRVLIEGHCDERGSSEYNMGLGENRARVVKEYLQNYGIPSNRMEITSWGKEKPVSYGCTDDACHSQNRRAEFKVLAK